MKLDRMDIALYTVSGLSLVTVLWALSWIIWSS